MNVRNMMIPLCLILCEREYCAVFEGASLALNDCYAPYQFFRTEAMAVDLADERNRHTSTLKDPVEEFLGYQLRRAAFAT